MSASRLWPSGSARAGTAGSSSTGLASARPFTPPYVVTGRSVFASSQPLASDRSCAACAAGAVSASRRAASEALSPSAASGSLEREIARPRTVSVMSPP
jgi:hypothetical protein